MSFLCSVKIDSSKLSFDFEYFQVLLFQIYKTIWSNQLNLTYEIWLNKLNLTYEIWLNKLNLTYEIWSNKLNLIFFFDEKSLLIGKNKPINEKTKS
jgi:hypothetical protein